MVSSKCGPCSVLGSKGGHVRRHRLQKSRDVGLRFTVTHAPFKRKFENFPVDVLLCFSISLSISGFIEPPSEQVACYSDVPGRTELLRPPSAKVPGAVAGPCSASCRRVVRAAFREGARGGVPGRPLLLINRFCAAGIRGGCRPSVPEPRLCLPL